MAIYNKMTDICMKILKTPELCGLYKQNNNGMTALIWACNNNLEIVKNKIKQILKILDTCMGVFYF